jgi:transcriptional regulator with XRE-family HTH domain
MSTEPHIRLRLALDRSGKTPSDLARIGNVSAQAVNHWLNGRNLPRRAILKKVCAALGITVEWLLEGDEELDPTTYGVQKDTNGGNPNESSLEPFDTPPYGKVPLIELEDLSVSEKGILLPVKPDQAKRLLDLPFPSGPRSKAFTMRDRSMEPRVGRGDIVVIDPDAEIVPGGLIAVRLISERRNVFRIFTYGTNGRVILTPANRAYETLEFEAASWKKDVIVLGIMSQRFENPST